VSADRIEKKPLITIVIPCLNEEAYIGRAIRSLLDSWAIRNCELLVVDGGSTDRTKQVVEDLIRNPPEAAGTLQNPPRPPFMKGGDLRSPCPPFTKGGSSNASGAGVSDAGKGAGVGSEGVGAGAWVGAQGRPEDEVVWLMQSRDRWVREVAGEWNPVTSGKRRAVISLLDNPDRTTATGMNMGIAQAAGKIIVRADAHWVFPPAYVRRCVELLADTGAANAGGVMVPRGEGGATQAAIALALRHPLGTGDAAFRRKDFKGEAEGVIFGTFRKALFDEIGGYDVKTPANEDSELNVRIVCAGKKIYLDSDIKITYFPRKTLRELAKQYFRYGRGRARTTLRHRMLTGWRQAAAPALVLVTAYAIVRAVLGRPVHLLVPAAYVLAIIGAAFLTLDGEKGKQAREAGMATSAADTPPDVAASFSLRRDGPARAGSGMGANAKGLSFKTRMTVAAAWAVMHLCWGAGFLFGLVKFW
jgi:glycosyltransferase involved in cell wall biosynthesis